MKSGRLKNFCQICRRQCKDQNGLHCHLNSAHHQKKLRELSTNPEQHIDKYSKQLQNRIVQILKVKYPGQPKFIEQIYHEYVEDKHHIKFNFTRWNDLSEFVQHLKTIKNLKVVGKLPSCKVTYVVGKVSDFVKKNQKDQNQKKKETEKEIAEKKMEDRIERIRKMQADRYKLEQQKMKNQSNSDGQIDIDKQQFRFDFDEKKYQPSSLFMGNENLEDQLEKNNTEKQVEGGKQKNIQKLLTELQSKNKTNHQDNDNDLLEDDQFEWILPGIIVKILPHEIPQIFQNKKAMIMTVKQPYTAEIKLGNATLVIDQAHLETVIPKIGHEIKLLKGNLRNQTATLKEVNIQKGIAVVTVDGNIFEVPFNQFSKIA